MTPLRSPWCIMHSPPVSSTGGLQTDRLLRQVWVKERVVLLHLSAAKSNTFAQNVQKESSGALCCFGLVRSRLWVKQLRGLKQRQTNVKSPPVCFSLFIYLEYEHLSPQYSQGVVTSVADVWFGVGMGRAVSWGEPRGSRLPIRFAGVWGRMGARKGRRGQRLGRLEILIRRPWRKSEEYISLVATHEAATCFTHKPFVKLTEWCDETHYNIKTRCFYGGQ